MPMCGRFADQFTLMQMQQHIMVLARRGRRAALTVEELKTVPEDAKTYRTIGKAWVAKPTIWHLAACHACDQMQC